ncbi:acetyl-CoA decarbonylase/synthase complex subunit alpha/beta [Dehalococcoides mccartyi]|uniref:acetyl-CoA decarbonylase/synthase complex subunit alpha/beta n=1 Tax=Dehalococcoides mccartyi TaxID=61435 RepID=UPI002AFE0531|nr:acetyl-CoA decarbonylase/synthase complex subunit alpha/beta [Dehalococcoides mccartyi]MEA2121907.1 Carbon monoxide dehydrogenase/acetyl-CoA synthase subunit alpha [Dehalococcoides mccartyi]
MSNTVAEASINGARNIVNASYEIFKQALAANCHDTAVGFPNTAYFLPVIYGILGIQVEKLSDMETVFDKCFKMLPPPEVKAEEVTELGAVLEAGLATLFAEEMLEALRYLSQPEYYTNTEDPTPDNIWLGAADDIILRKRGVEFVDGTAPGFAAIIGAAPDNATAESIAAELQQKNLYTFMCGESQGKRFASQLADADVELGWTPRLVSFGDEPTAAIFAFGVAVRGALSFGNVEPGNRAKLFEYSQERIKAFVMPLGDISDEWYANAAGALNFGFPIIADKSVLPVLPGVDTVDSVLAGIPYDRIVSKAMDVRGIKVNITKVPVPVAYGPAYEGERVRGEQIYLECGGGRTQMVELVTTAGMDDVTDGKIELFGQDIANVPEGSRLPLAIVVEAAGHKMNEDYEPILERQIHHLLNYAQGVMHIGQRDIAWLRVSKGAAAKGFSLKHIGSILHAKLHQDFGGIVDKIQIKLYTTPEKVAEISGQSKKIYAKRDERIEGMTDENTETFYSCTLCQSFAPSHVCIVSPERTGLCGAYNWMDCRASNEINNLGPNQPVNKGAVIDAKLGQWSGINQFVEKTSGGVVSHYNLYSIIHDPMTTCGCCECIAAILPLCNGVMTVNREYAGMTPCGMKFTTLAGTIGGGITTPGFLGHSKYNITQRKFISAEDGLLRLVWMPKSLKDEIRERFNARAAELGIPDLLERIADESVGTTEEEILPFLEAKQHPALTLEPLI